MTSYGKDDMKTYAPPSCQLRDIATIERILKVNTYKSEPLVIKMTTGCPIISWSTGFPLPVITPF